MLLQQGMKSVPSAGGQLNINSSFGPDIKKKRAMSFLPSVECGKFKLKKVFQSGKILACTKKSEICATSTLKLIKMMLKCQVAQASSTCMLYYNLIMQF